MQTVFFIITIIAVLLGNFSVSAEDHQSGWKHTAKPQLGEGRSKLRQYKNFDFWTHKRKAQYSFELPDANLVFGNQREYTNYGLVIYDYNHNQALLAARFLILKNTDKTKSGKFRVTLIDIKYKNDKIIPICDKIIAGIENQKHRTCAERFMAMVKRGIARDKALEKQQETGNKTVKKTAEEKSETVKDKDDAIKEKTASKVKAEAPESKEDSEIPSSEISIIF